MRRCSHAEVAGPWNHTDFDGAWKEALERYFRPFLALCFPKVESGIDWQRPVEFVDKELPSVKSGAGRGAGRMYVDKLVKVHTVTGRLHRVLVHLEIQSQPDPDLPGRLYEYHRRLSEVRGLPVATLAVLADDQPSFRPKPFESELWECRVRFEYPTCKLLAFEEDVLRREGSAIGRFILAHRVAQKTSRDPRARLRLKLAILEEACTHQGFSETEVRQLLWLVDRITGLPEKEENELRQELEKRHRRNIMTYISSFERYGLKKGLQRGLRQGLRRGRQEGRQEGREEGREEGRLAALREIVREAVETRFGILTPARAQRIESEPDGETLHRWHRLAITAPTAKKFWEQVEG